MGMWVDRRAMVQSGLHINNKYISNIIIIIYIEIHIIQRGSPSYLHLH